MMLKDSNNLMQGFCFIPCQRALSQKERERKLYKSQSLRQLPPTLTHLCMCRTVSNGLMFYCKYVSLICAVVRNFIPCFKLKTIVKSRKRTKRRY